MTPKQRVYAALKKEPLDRIPVFMWFHPQTAQRLGKLLEIPASYVPLALGDDIRQRWVNNNYAMEGIVHEKDGQSHVDEWHIEWTRIDGFNQITKYPLAQASEQQLLDYQFPTEKKDYLVGRMDSLMTDSQQYFIGCDVSPNIFEMYWRLRGIENTFAEMSSNPGLAGRMFEKCADFSIELSERACKRYNFDWLWLGDDAGCQKSMLMSPQMWRDMIKPLLKRIVDVGKSYGRYVAFHSCGSIRPIISDLVEIGIDVLNPIQCNCEGMAPADLKKEFGKDLAFMGGLDTHGVLPRGTADDVRKATERLISEMTLDGGGFILAASHTVPPETPDENILAMYEAAGIKKEQIFDKAAQLRKLLNSFSKEESN